MKPSIPGAVFGALMATLCIAGAQADPFISEILASNRQGITDAAGNYPDWIELHNPGPAVVDLAGWHLTTDPGDLNRYTFPAGFTIPAGGYRVIFAMEKPVPAPGEYVTGFALNRDGAYLALVKPDGLSIASSFTPGFPRQKADVSYGRSGLSDPTGYYFGVPTPGAANGTAYDGYLGDTTFSAKRGLYDTPFQLQITTPDPLATIRYTLDGSVPDPTTGLIYTAPLSISTTRIVRAIAYRTGYLPTNVDTHTYLFPAQVIQQPAIVEGWPNPTYSLGTGTAVHDYAMDPAVVAAPAYSSMMIQSMRSIPSLSVVLPAGGIFGTAGFYDGTDIEKPTSVELLYPDTPSANEHADGGIEGHSHIRLKRSMRLNFRRELGDSSFRTELFNRMPWNPPSNQSQDRLILRAGNNRAWSRSWSKEKTEFCLDELARQTQLAVSGYGMRGAFVHLYLNGLYWGVFNVTERADTHFNSGYFGGIPDDWFAINHGGELSGSDVRYNYLTGTLKNKSMAVTANYEELRGYLDIDGMIDYLMVQWYPATGDWPANNWYAAHRLPSSPLGATPLRYFAWDGEWSWDLPHSSAPNPAPYHPWVHPEFRKTKTKNEGAPLSRLFNSAKDNPAFRLRMADRAHQLCFNGGPLTDGVMSARYQLIAQYVRDAIVAESARWGDSLKGSGQPTYTRDAHWLPEVAVIQGLISGRAARFIAALRTEGYYPAIDPPVANQRGGTVVAGFPLSLTNPNPSGTIFYTLDGTDPAEPGALTYSTPVLLTASAKVRSRVQAGAVWSASDDLVFVIPAPAALRISEIMYHPAPPTPAEAAAGFTDQDDFEFLEIHNRSAAAQQLAGYRFTEGIPFVFPSYLLPPGARVVIVSNPAAFQMRYGTGAVILGSYSPSRLSNGGEPLSLASQLNETIANFSYGEAEPWPSATDGTGRSLVFVDSPAGADPSLPVNWRASPGPAGFPGRDETLTFSAWAKAWLAARPAVERLPHGDPDSDGIVNLLEYAFGMDPFSADASALPEALTIDGRPGLRYLRDPLKPDVQVSAEQSANPASGTWSSDGITASQLASAHGMEPRQFHLTAPATSRALLRLRVALTPP